MPRFSLIVPTLGRTTEVAELFASIVDQNRSDVELIVVDQNDDDRIVPLIEDLSQRYCRLVSKTRGEESLDGPQRRAGSHFR